MIKHNIQQSFSKAANHYDELSGLHRRIADELLMRINPQQSFKHVLDIGCGTGYLANQLSNAYPRSQVVAIDFAEGMLTEAVAQQHAVNYIQADATQLPFKTASFDLVVSNLAYQWIEPLDQQFIHLKNILTDQGQMAIALFGEATCDELMQSLTAVGIQPLKRLPNVSAVKKAVEQAGFKSAAITSERVKIQLNNIFELLSWLKNIGANQLPIKGFLGRQKLFVMSEFYRQRFPLNDGIVVSLEVIWIKI